MHALAGRRVLLRAHHERIEAWILKEAKIEFDPATAAPGIQDGKSLYASWQETH